MKNKLWVKILVPILIIAAIGGIWIVKNATEKPADDSGGSQNNTELSDNLKDADFGLRETEAIDFEALSAFGLPIIIDYGADSRIGKSKYRVLRKSICEDHQCMGLSQRSKQCPCSGNPDTGIV